MTISVSHLLDDPTVGGVTRMLEFLQNSSGFAESSRHETVLVKRGQFRSPSLAADIIVSNLFVCWRNFPLFASLRAAHPNTPLIHVEHSYCERFVALHVDNRDRFETLLRSVYALFDHVVAVSEQQARWLRRKGLVRADRLQVIGPLVELEPFFKVPYRWAGAKRIVGAIGRMDPQKGFDILIDAFNNKPLPDYELHLYGRGPQLDELKAQAGNNPSIVFKGFVQSPALAMAECDIIAMPSRWEPYGLVAIEAMAASRPLICSRADGLADHIAAGAYDVRENTPQGWAARLRQFDQFDLWPDSVRSRRHALNVRRRFFEDWKRLLGGTAGLGSEEVRASAA